MSTVEDIRKVLQDFLAPELLEIKVKIDALNNRLDELRRPMDQRFTSLEPHLR